MVSIVVIGLGRVFDHYLKICERDNLFSKFKIVAVIDKDNKKFCKLDHLEGTCLFFSALDEFFSANVSVDAAWILSPSHLHFLHFSEFINRGIPALVEKPVVLNWQDYLACLDLPIDRKKLICPVFQNRSNKAVVAAKELIADEKVVLCETRVLWSRKAEYYQDEWHGRWHSDGGVIAQQAIHHIDALLFLLGDLDYCISIAENQTHNIEAEDTMLACLKLKSGCTGTFLATTALTYGDFKAEINLFTEKKVVSVTGLALNELLIDERDGKGFKKINEFSESVESGYGWSHSAVLEEFHNLVIHSKQGAQVEWSVGLEDALRTVKALHAMYRASESENQEVLSMMSTGFSRLGNNEVQ